MAELSDVAHWFGGDLLLSPTGDLARVTRIDRSRQRVLRRLLTAEGLYMAHPGYGSSLPQRVGQVLDLAAIKGEVGGQMSREVSVDQTTAPNVKVAAIVNGVTVSISYDVAPEQIPAVLSFDVSDPDGA